jgi:hypothetical protein
MTAREGALRVVIFAASRDVHGESQSTLHVCSEYSVERLEHRASIEELGTRVRGVQEIYRSHH